MEILLAILMILLVIRLILKYAKTNHRASEGSEIRSTTIDPASFQLRDELDFRI